MMEGCSRTLDELPKATNEVNLTVFDFLETVAKDRVAGQ